VDPAGLDAAAVAAAFAGTGATELHVEETAPSLEDVFLAVVDRSAAAEGVKP
jgi:hypothetical protein